MIIGIEWNEFLNTPLWKIRNRAFIAGEDRVLSHIQNLDCTYIALTASQVKNPSEVLNQYRDEVRDLILVEESVSDEELIEKKVEHNKRMADTWKNGK